MRALFSWLNRENTRNSLQWGTLVFATVQIFRFTRADNRLLGEVRSLKETQDSLSDEVNRLKHAANANTATMSRNEAIPVTTISK